MSVSNGQHVVVPIVGMPNPVVLDAGDTDGHDDLVTMGNEFLELEAQAAPELPLQCNLQLASTMADFAVPGSPRSGRDRSNPSWGR